MPRANATLSLPLAGLTVLEFCQYLAGPLAGLRLADLGARVIKIERPLKETPGGSGNFIGGDACRQLAIKNQWVETPNAAVGGRLEKNSLLFHTINRNKQSFAADLKNQDDLAAVKRLIAQADVMTHNFRPGVMEKIGLDYDAVRALNPRLVYGIVTGYGNEGPWRDKPGQDLLVQSLSGLAHLSGSRAAGPVPFGLSIADTICGNHLAQGLLAALLRRERAGADGVGGLVEVSLLESTLDLQFEVLTTFLNDGGKPPNRAAHAGAGHAYLRAPYGIYATRDGHLALAMNDVAALGAALGDAGLAENKDTSAWFTQRDEIMAGLSRILATRTTAEWLTTLEPRGIWCSDVLNWQQFFSSPAFASSQMDQLLTLPDGKTLRALRSPLRIEGEPLFSPTPAPLVGQHNAELLAEFINSESPIRTPRPLTLDPLPPQPAPLPLADLLVIDLSQFLSGPSASLRLADLGARVIKIERPGSGDICRDLYVSDLCMNGSSSIFHAINRNKESFAADLKSPTDLAHVRALIARADVVLHNFRPGVIERLGLDYNSVRALNPGIVYGEISGYGSAGPWAAKPGQDLLLQALTGLTWLTGNAADGPVPMGLSVIDMLAGAHLAQGLLALLLRRARIGGGGLAQVSMLESSLDFQFEVVTTHFNDGGELPQRTATNGANAYLGAPYGIYATADGHLALAMGSIPKLGELLGCAPLTAYTDPATWFAERNAIKATLAAHLATQPKAHWLGILEPADIWCAEVLDWPRLLAHDGFRVLEMLQDVQMDDGYTSQTTRCPIRLDGARLFARRGAPELGAHTAAIAAEFALPSSAASGTAC